MTIHWILTQELKMRWVCSAWVLHMLTVEQMNTRDKCASEFLGMTADHPDYFNHIISADESGCTTLILCPNKRAGSGRGKTKFVWRKFVSRNPQARSRWSLFLTQNATFTSTRCLRRWRWMPSTTMMFQKLVDATSIGSDPSWRITTISSTTTQGHIPPESQNILRQIIFALFHIHTTHLILRHAISGCSQLWRRASVGADSIRMKK